MFCFRHQLSIFLTGQSCFTQMNNYQNIQTKYTLNKCTKMRQYGHKQRTTVTVKKVLPPVPVLSIKTEICKIVFRFSVVLPFLISTSSYHLLDNRHRQSNIFCNECLCSSRLGLKFISSWFKKS